MYLEVFLLIILVVLFGYLFFHYADILFAPITKQNPVNKVCFGSECFAVELAKTTSEQERGLMNRAELDKNKGMLFVFNTVGLYPFWMKDTLIPLDIIWLDSNGKVVFMAQNVQPCKTLICPNVNPLMGAKYVLEINAGLASEKGIKVGSVATITIQQ